MQRTPPPTITEISDITTTTTHPYSTKQPPASQRLQKKFEYIAIPAQLFLFLVHLSYLWLCLNCYDNDLPDRKDNCPPARKVPPFPPNPTAQSSKQDRKLTKPGSPLEPITKHTSNSA